MNFQDIEHGFVEDCYKGLVKAKPQDFQITFLELLCAKWAPTFSSWLSHTSNQSPPFKQCIEIKQKDSRSRNQ